MDWLLLKEPGIWSAFIAALALILSQVPPIRTLLKGKKIRIVVPELFQIYHFLGNVQFNLFIDVHNAGGRTISITKIDCLIADEHGKVWNMPARTYYSRQPPQPNTPPQELLLGSITLKPGDSWSETVRCYRLWTETEEESANDIISKIKKSILEKLPSETLVEADQEFIDEAISFFDNLFNLHKGNYQLVVAALSDDNSLIAVRGFDFTLFESNISMLRSTIEDYKNGFGIYLPPDQTKTVWGRLKPVADDNKVLEAYKKLRQLQ